MFGGLAPLPIRLGAASDESVAPEQWLRLAVDAASANAPLAVLYIVEPISGSGVCTVTGLCRQGANPGEIITATCSTSPGPGVRSITVTFPAYYTDNNGARKNWTPRTAFCKGVEYEAVGYADQTLINGNVISIAYYYSGDTTGHHTLVVWGTTEDRFSGDYGAEPTKEASKLEGDLPYAWIWLQEMRALRGDAFTNASFIEYENLAFARYLGYLQRTAERHAACQLPTNADQTIGRWATIMGIGTANSRDWQVRRNAAAKLALTAGGPTTAAVTAAAQAVFAGNFVAIHRYPGTLDTPPDPTYWPGGTIGPGSLDIGGDKGPWMSQRYHWVFQLSALNDADRVRLQGIASRDMDDLLRSSLPPVNTWEYAFDAPGSFALDYDTLGVGPL